MDLQPFVTQYLPPLLAATIVVLGLVLFLAWLASRGAGTRLWRGVVRYRGPLAFLFLVVLFTVAFMTFVLRAVRDQRSLDFLPSRFATPANLLYGAGFTQVPLTGTVYTSNTPLSATPPVGSGWEADVPEGESLLGPVFAVRPGESYSYWLTTTGGTAKAQGRLIWFDRGLEVLSWDDSPVWTAGAGEYHSQHVAVPPGAAYARLQLRNASEPGTGNAARVLEPGVMADGAYIEPHPNGALAAVAFSFDWETAMGGAVHSKGNETHDTEAAARHGLAMREGADWLANMFKRHGVHATFYATGYNLLDGNTERRKFNGDPTYDWASPENEWATEYWLKHPWFSDDPFGTAQSDPAWYFGDQARRLLAGGHEIAPHTFAHIYVRGSNPAEMATDLDSWLQVAQEAGVPEPSTFAFPWRSSNSLTEEFYDVLHERGIRAVTRIYPLDVKDLYVLGNAVVYTDVKQPQLYPEMAVMPDFLLGAAAYNAGEEASGATIGLDEGLAILGEAMSRRGTTSFWTHPEQLAGDNSLAPVRASWEGVVRTAADARDRGALWVDTVEAITAFQRDVMSVTVSFSGATSLPNVLYVDNASGKEQNGITLSFGTEALSVKADGVTIRPVTRDGCPGLECRVMLAEPANGTLASPANQIVLDGLKPGVTSIQVEWKWPPRQQK